MKRNDTYWIQHTHLFRRDEYECSACSYVSDTPHKTCPACGAWMLSSKYDPSFVDEADILSMILDD